MSATKMKEFLCKYAYDSIIAECVSNRLCSSDLFVLSCNVRHMILFHPPAMLHLAQQQSIPCLSSP